MKRLLILSCLCAALASCNADPEEQSQVQSFASNLSDSTGRLPQTFLYLSEGQSVVQRECQKPLPADVQDCATVRSRMDLNLFRQSVQDDVNLSTKRLNDAMVPMQQNRSQLLSRQTQLKAQIADLEGRLRAPGAIPGGRSEDLGHLQAALQFAQQSRDQVQAQLNGTRDPAMQTQLRDVLVRFDQQIADLKARIAAAGGGGNGQEELRRQLEEARKNLRQVESDLAALDTKIQESQRQLNTVNEENRILGASIEKLKQSQIFDERDNTPADPERQLVSRFHKLFKKQTPDCSERPVDAMKELAVGMNVVYNSREAQVGGSWHAGTIIGQLLGGDPSPQQVEATMRSWASHWERDVSINNDRSSVRSGLIALIDRWKQASQARGVNGLDLRQAPFRLIGITNRLDLRNPLNAGDAGEARLVYALLDNPTDRPQDDGQNPRPFTAIFEYKVNTKNDADLRKWARLWHDLGALSCNNANDCQTYINNLASVTRMVTHKGQNGFLNARLGQLRTNEIAFGNPWELREFHLQGNNFTQVELRLTPTQGANNSQDLGNFVNSISLDDLRKNNYALPQHLRSAKAQVVGGAPEWRVPADAEKARVFNLNTCNGCHSNDEAIVDGFYHISPFKNPGSEAMSDFLRNKDMPQRVRNLANLSAKLECVAGTPFDSRLSSEVSRFFARPVH